MPSLRSRLMIERSFITTHVPPFPLLNALLSHFAPQNDLEEFFAMVDFTNPGVLGDAAYFR